MFHRVKSDAEKNQSNTISQAEQAKEEQISVQVNNEAEQNAPIIEEKTSIPVKETATMSNAPTQTQEEKAPQAAYAATSARPAAAPFQSSYASGYNPPSPNGEETSEERRLVIGKGITVSGEIESCDYLLVEGTIEAALKGAQTLEISESGTFFGTVEIEEATVSGRFEGDITVNGRLTVSSTGTITGSIAYRELDVQAGAMIDGKLTPIRGQVQKEAPKPTTKNTDKAAKEAAALAKARELKAQNEQPSPANTDGELFGDQTAAAAE